MKYRTAAKRNRNRPEASRSVFISLRVSYTESAYISIRLFILFSSSHNADSRKDNTDHHHRDQDRRGLYLLAEQPVHNPKQDCRQQSGHDLIQIVLQRFRPVAASYGERQIQAYVCSRHAAYHHKPQHGGRFRHFCDNAAAADVLEKLRPILKALIQTQVTQDKMRDIDDQEKQDRSHDISLGGKRDTHARCDQF